jgi:hypothetical protein
MEAPRSKPKRVPRKQLFVNQIDQLLLLTEAQLKVWLYHYRREGGGDGRKSWASRVTVGGATGFSRPTISHARTWLVENGWLKVVGYRENHHGGSPVREYRCLFPVSQGKASDTMRNSQGKTSDTPQSKTSDPSRVKPAAPEVRSPLEVTAQAPIPGEVFRLTNSDGSEQVNNPTSAAEASPPAVVEVETETGTIEHFEAWLNGLGDEKLLERWGMGLQSDPKVPEHWIKKVHLVNTLQPVSNPQTMRSRLSDAAMILGLLPENIDAMDVLVWNRAHKKGKMYLRTCAQYLAALMSKEDHLLNDYCTDDSEHCKICKEHKFVSWSQQMAARQREEAEAARREAAEKRERQLARFEFRAPTDQEIDAFLALRGDSWTEKCLNTALINRELDRRCAEAAMLFALRQNHPIAWDAFVILVKQIEELSSPQGLSTMNSRAGY